MSYTNFPAIKVGGWNFEDPVSHDQISLIQEYLLKCPNFVDGGSYNPSSQIVLGGTTGFRFNCPSVFTKKVDLSIGQGQLVESYKEELTNGDFLYADTHRRVRADLPTGSNILYLSNTLAAGGSPAFGSIIEVVNMSQTNQAKLRRQAEGTDTIVLPSGGKYWAEFFWESNSTWQVHRYYTGA